MRVLADNNLRLLIKYQNVLRQVARINVSKRDGSINLILPFTELSIRISIHLTGRVNFWEDGKAIETCFIPCLLDLPHPISVFGFVASSVENLNLIKDTKSNDSIILLDDHFEGNFGIQFFVVPNEKNSTYRKFLIEEKYGLAWDIYTEKSLLPSDDAAINIQAITPGFSLLKQQASEEVAFLRYKHLKRENNIRKYLSSLNIPKAKHEELFFQLKEQNQAQGPNNEGRYEIVCKTPKRAVPRLKIFTENPDYQAKIIDQTPNDRRLEKVRVQFEIHDKKGNKIKTPVNIFGFTLNCRLYGDD